MHNKQGFISILKAYCYGNILYYMCCDFLVVPDKNLCAGFEAQIEKVFLRDKKESFIKIRC